MLQLLGVLAAVATAPITDAVWAKLPTVAEMSAYYPAPAVAQMMDGAAIVECTVSADGRMSGCNALAEQPESLQFGEAAARIAALFRIKPKTRSGAPVEGRVIRVPIAFTIPWHALDPQRAGMVHVIASLPWVKWPSRGEAARFFPSIALRKNVDGEAILHCRIDPDGHLSGCKVVRENPADFDFGAAALKLAPSFQVDVLEGLGAASVGKDADLPFNFVIPN